MPAAPEPLTDTELAGIAAARLASYATIVLAVSGGADSMCLIELARSWRAASANPLPAIHVATVDHCLRAQSATEAAAVATAAALAGLPHHTLVWDGSATTSALQATARQARYRLLSDLAAHLSGDRPAAIVTAHHAGDQAETMLMRLARGSGIDGLAAMAPVRTLQPSDGHPSPRIDLVRPFLELPKQRLVATLTCRGRTWFEDPGNTNTAFERIRVRRAVSALQEAGIEPAAMALTASRLHRARAALEKLTAELGADTVDLHDGAFATIRTDLYDRAPTELRLRLLQRLWPAFAAPGPPVRLAQLEAIEKRLATEPEVAATLAGARIERTPGRLTLIRETGRQGLPALPLTPGTTTLWDGRFVVTTTATAGPGLVVMALPAQTLSTLLAERQTAGHPPLGIPRTALLTLPSLWRGEAFLGVLHPSLAPETGTPATATFAGRFGVAG